MSYHIAIISPEGERVPLADAPDHATAEAARVGAQALLDLFSDEMELEDGYRIELGEGSGEGDNMSSSDDDHERQRDDGRDRYRIDH